MSTIYVIMGNDFPTGGVDDEKRAAEIIEERNATDKRDAPTEHRARIYWRSYPFNLNEVGQ